MLAFFYKAKGKPVGTVSKRKSGQWVKDKPNHWSLLREHVKAAYGKDNVHSNNKHAKAMQRAAAGLLKHMKKQSDPTDKAEMRRWLHDNFEEPMNLENFAAWRNRVVEAMSRYLAEMGSKPGSQRKAQGKVGERLKDWKSEITERLRSGDIEATDQWVVGQFKKRGKNIAHIIHAARSFAGKSGHTGGAKTGFIGFCRAVLQQFYDHGPDGVQQSTLDTWTKAFKTAMKRSREGYRDTRGGDSVYSLREALTFVNDQPYWRENPKLFEYCVRRTALMHGGHVDMRGITSYMHNAERKYGKKLPKVDYDMRKALGYIGPMTPSDINAEAWTNYFDEGGMLNLPDWLSHKSVDDIRHKFQFLAKYHA